MSQRATWASKAGFVLASAGAAVGLGAIWKFPWLAGSNGGSAFVLPYVLLSLTLGFVFLTAEITLGYMGRGSIVTTMRKLGGSRWLPVGYMGVATGLLVLSFYSAIGGWTIAYLVDALIGRGLVTDQAQLGARFASVSGNPTLAIGYQALFLALTAGIVALRVNKGIERLSRVLMPALFILMLLLIVRGLTLPGAGRGLAYLFAFRPEAFTRESLYAALGFTFFSLCVGCGCMMTYGSYLPQGSRILRSCAEIVGLTTLASILGALMVMPSVFAFGLDPAAGPGLTFVTMPAVFAQLPAGGLFAIAFYACLTFAALTSSVSLLELDAAFLVDEHGFSRAGAAGLCSVAVMAVGIFCSLSFGPLADAKFLGKNAFEWCDFLTSNISLPLGGLAVALLAGVFCWPAFRRAVATGSTLTEGWFKLFRVLLTVACPILVIAVLVTGLL